MRLVRLRHWSRVVALLLLVISVRPFHAASDDPGCAWPDAVSTRDGASALGKANDATTEAQDHCAICHWTRLLRSPLTGTGLTVAAIAPTTPFDSSRPGGYVAPTHDHLPARAPPVFLG
jgi:hypothetical protein